MRRNSLTIILVLMLALLPLKDVSAQSYVYFDQNQGWFSLFSPPSGNSWAEIGFYWQWNSQPHQGPSFYKPINWRATNTSTEVLNYAREAVQEWSAILPAWTRFQEVSAGTSTALTVSEQPACITLFVLGCFGISGWAWEGTLQNNSWSTGYIMISYGNASQPLTAAGREQVVKHEFGHAIGLHERYPSGGGCNAGEVSVMEGTFTSGGMSHPCDGTVAPTALDASRINTYYTTGIYQKNGADNTSITGNLFSASWLDFAYAEAVMEIDVQYHNGANWVQLTPPYKQYHSTGIGSHEYTGNPNSIQTSTNLSIFAGAPHGKWYRVCVKPVFANLGGNSWAVGSVNCSSNEWWP